MIRRLTGLGLGLALILCASAASAAPGFVQLPIQDSGGNPRYYWVWSSDGTLAGNLSQTIQLVDSTQTPVIGEVSSTPTANTLLDRLKTLHTDMVSLISAVGSSTPAGAATIGGVNLISVGPGSTAANQSTEIAGVNSLVAAIGSVPAVTATDRAGTVTTGGTAQTAIAANSSRKGWCIQNPPSATETLQVRSGTAATSTTGVTLAIGGQACNPPGIIDQGIVSVLAATTGHAWQGTEYQ